MKRRLCRMLLLTMSFRKSRGELRGDSLGDVAFRFPPPTPGILGGSSSRCMCSLNVRMQESMSTLSSLDDIPAAFTSSSLQSKLSHIRQLVGETLQWCDGASSGLLCRCTSCPPSFSWVLGIIRPKVVLSPALFFFRGALSTAGSHAAPPWRQTLFPTLLLPFASLT